MPWRNDKCPCKSGKKYKKCCLMKDRERDIKRAAPIAKAVGGLERVVAPKVKPIVDAITIPGIFTSS